MAKEKKMASTRILLYFTVLFSLASFTSAQHRDAPTVWNSSLSTTEPEAFSLFRRADARTCSSTQPCSDGSCCAGNTRGLCGIDKDHCAPGVCISNCDAKAECGQYADPPGKKCPLNVCCGKWGFCGTTQEFCTNGCQSNCEQPPSTGLNTGDVTGLVIGYYEAWAPYRRGGCPRRHPSWIKTDSITHLYVAFGYITPDTYEIYPMDQTSEEILREIMQLKETAPGLKIYISLGGWTYTDNGTDTQPVWGDLASTPQKRQKFIMNLVNFMTNFGFDGVDLDWEYPGAPDRGGQERDVANFVQLLSDIREWWTAQTNGWGLSFTAPTSYWYMRWFDLENLVKSVDWVNLMTYDLHGSWDSPEDQIGSYVYAHTNISEITDALNLLWRNNVPANKVNLGLGFYGRSYTLEDPSCTLPGCKFKDPGRAGSCTGTAGILSYQEITAIAETYSVSPVLDKAAASMYFAYDQDQWISYDNVQTIKTKVDYANKNGLLGLFIWSLDLDNDKYDALAAVLDGRGGLGAFRERNGVGPPDLTHWQPGRGTCFLSACNVLFSCPASHIRIGHTIGCEEDGKHRIVCCPRDQAPDERQCLWRSSIQSFLGLSSVDCTDGCRPNEISIAESKWYYENSTGANMKCDSGVAQYCCTASETATTACKPSDECVKIGNDGKPVDSDPCHTKSTGRVFATYSQDTCPKGKWRPWCCDANFDASQCKWQGPSTDTGTDECKKASSCPSNYINMGVSEKGGGSNCAHYSWAPMYGLGGPTWYQRAFCCPAGDQVIYNQTAPVPLAWLFVDEVPSSDKQSFHLDVQVEKQDDEEDPNQNGFGWVIMTGPKEELTSLDKRDGSHWELFDCPDRDAVTQDDRITVRAVCSDDSSDSNCDAIFHGGVPRTVVEMPPACGIGRYAMAVGMETSQNQTLPSPVFHKLVKRGANFQRAPRIFDFTFDYDFSVLHGRDDSHVQIRIDYSEDPGYWRAIVDNDPKNDPKNSKRKREMEEEVHRNHNGSWKRYAEHTFRTQRRETPKHEMHEFNKRWWADDLDSWMDSMEYLNEKEFGQEIKLATHHIQDTFPFVFFNQHLQCSFYGVPYTAYYAVWADLHVDIQTSAQLTLIGRLNDLSSWKQSHVLFRNKGSIQAGLHMEAQATLRFSTGQLELFGMQNFGGAFQVPGLVTIGPNFRVLGQLTGTFTAHAQAHYNLEVASWDYSQRYPNPNNDVASGLTDKSGMASSPSAGIDENKKDGFSADITVKGDITMEVTPLVEFGIRWNPKYKVSDTTISLQLNTHATLYGNAGAGTSTTPNVCYGAVAGAELFAQLKAPTMFGVNPNRRWSFYKRDFSIIEEKCYELGQFSPSTCPDC